MPQSPIFNVANMSNNDIRENKILAKCFEFYMVHIQDFSHIRRYRSSAGFYAGLVD